MATHCAGMNFNTKTIVTLGPSTNTEADLRKIKDKGVDFVRINMSHSSLDDLKRILMIAKKVGIPFIIDTEGSQIRTGNLLTETIELEENEEVKIFEDQIVGERERICFKPGSVIRQLEAGDIVHVDFDTLTLAISDTSTVSEGYITARTLTKGFLGRNKAVVIDSALQKKIHLPPLSKKDEQSIQIGLAEGVGYIAASFMRSGESVDEVRRATQHTMKIISKIECVEALENVDAIIKKSDFILIDRGDLSKEIPVEKIPFVQKIIISKAKRYGVQVFVATNLLETMIEKRKPTRAEVHDVIDTIVDGAAGLTLSAETAIGKYPMACINMLNKLIRHAQLLLTHSSGVVEEKRNFIERLETSNYLLDPGASSSLVSPHGGKLVDRILHDHPHEQHLRSLQKIQINESQQMDVEQIAVGAYSPLEGFMGNEDLQCVLDNMKLANGIVWPIPIVCDVTEKEAERISVGEPIALVDHHNEIMALLYVEEKFRYSKSEMAKKVFGTESRDHPGVKMVEEMKPMLLSGKIDLLRRKKADFKGYEFTPRQVRRVFEERGWAKVVGFHTRNVIHRSHEFIQLKALQEGNCDGLFVHPIIGRKKRGDFDAKYVLKAYELMKKHFYPKDCIVFAAFATYSRYAGPRESLFTALCRKNFGCSHFIVGRDHTGVGEFYHPKASHTIFDRFPDLGITPVRFNTVFYSKKAGHYVHEREGDNHTDEDKLHISGTQAREMFERGETPPEWFMRPEISAMILDAMRKGQKVFV